MNEQELKSINDRINNIDNGINALRSDIASLSTNLAVLARSFEMQADATIERLAAVESRVSNLEQLTQETRDWRKEIKGKLSVAATALAFAASIVTVILSWLINFFMSTQK